MTPGLTWGDVWARACATKSVAIAKLSVRTVVRIPDRPQAKTGHRPMVCLGGISLPTIGNRGEIGTAEVFHRGSVVFGCVSLLVRFRPEQDLDIVGWVVFFV